MFSLDNDSNYKGNFIIIMVENAWEITAAAMK